MQRAFRRLAAVCAVCFHPANCGIQLTTDCGLSPAPGPARGRATGDARRIPLSGGRWSAQAVRGLGWKKLPDAFQPHLELRQMMVSAIANWLKQTKTRPEEAANRFDVEPTVFHELLLGKTSMKLENLLTIWTLIGGSYDLILDHPTVPLPPEHREAEFLLRHRRSVPGETTSDTVAMQHGCNGKE